MHQLARLSVSTLILMAAACATLPGGTPSASGQLPFLLPEDPPDSIPADAWEDDPYWRAPLDVFAVTFRPGLTREEKTRLVVDVGVIELVGGAPFSHDKWEDGMYLVRIRDDGTMNPLLKAVDALSEHPDVISAFMLVTMGVNSANKTGWDSCRDPSPALISTAQPTESLMKGPTARDDQDVLAERYSVASGARRERG